MSRRFGTFCAVWLIAQILLPFTAPFPVCDLADFLAVHHTSTAPVPRSMPGRKALADASYSYAPPLETADGRLRLVVVTHVDAVTPDSGGLDLRTAPRSTGDLIPPQPQFQQQQSILRL